MDLKAVNQRVAVSTVTWLSTMACVWLFLAWSILPLIWPATRDTVFYVSGGILQLVLLPLIMVGQAYLSQASDAQSKEQHDAVVEILGDVRADHATLREILADVKADHAARHEAVMARLEESQT